MPPISVMIKPSSGMCNLRCRYCFYSDVSAKREEYFLGMMTKSTAEKLIKSAFEYADGNAVCFTFQGGEPLLSGIDFFREFVKSVREENRKNIPVTFGLQTNGTLINSEWAEFFRRNSFLIGLSLDGCYKDNLFRVDGKGVNCHGKVMKAAKILEKHGVEFNILTVLTGNAAEHAAEIYTYFRDNGLKYLQFIPCLRPFGSNEQSELYMTDEQYADYLISVFRLFTHDWKKGNYVSIRYFDNLVRMYLGERPEQCGLCGSCSQQFVIEGNGNAYPCDFYCTDKYLLGNINETGFSELAAGEKMKAFLNAMPEIPEKCRKCEYYGLCRAGGCKRQRTDHDYCASYKKFFGECLSLLDEFRRYN